LNALDARAATYEKLGDLQPALRDAKKMIDEMPKLSKVCPKRQLDIAPLMKHRAISVVERYCGFCKNQTLL